MKWFFFNKCLVANSLNPKNVINSCAFSLKLNDTNSLSAYLRKTINESICVLCSKYGHRDYAYGRLQCYNDGRVDDTTIVG